MKEEREEEEGEEGKEEGGEEEIDLEPHPRRVWIVWSVVGPRQHYSLKCLR